MKKGLILTLGLALLLAGCTAGPIIPSTTPVPSVTPTAPVPPTEAPGTAEFVLPCYADQGFHPILGQNRTNLNLAPLVYEGLFELDGSFTPKGQLAGGYTVSEDALTWTFALADAEFSPGVALTAQDVVYSLRLAMGEGSLYAARLTNLKSVAESGDGGVVIALRTPNGNLPALLDVPVVREAGEAPPLGTGDYAIVPDGEGFTLRRKAGSPAPADHIRLYTLQAADGLIHAFDTREISLVAADLTGTNALGFSGSYEAWDYPTSVLLYMGYNAKKGPCADRLVRKALSYNFDRAAVAKSLLSGHAAAAALPFSPASLLYDKTLAAALGYAPPPRMPR